jgi:hypothetical protein
MTGHSLIDCFHLFDEHTTSNFCPEDEAACFSKIFVTIYQTTQCSKPEDHVKDIRVHVKEI